MSRKKKSRTATRYKGGPNSKGRHKSGPDTITRSLSHADAFVIDRILNEASQNEASQLDRSESLSGLISDLQSAKSVIHLSIDSVNRKQEQDSTSLYTEFEGALDQYLMNGGTWTYLADMRDPHRRERVERVFLHNRLGTIDVRHIEVPTSYPTVGALLFDDRRLYIAQNLVDGSGESWKGTDPTRFFRTDTLGHVSELKRVFEGLWSKAKLYDTQPFVIPVDLAASIARYSQPNRITRTVFSYLGVSVASPSQVAVSVGSKILSVISSIKLNHGGVVVTSEEMFDERVESELSARFFPETTNRDTLKAQSDLLRELASKFKLWLAGNPTRCIRWHLKFDGNRICRERLTPG